MRLLLRSVLLSTLLIPGFAVTAGAQDAATAQRLSDIADLRGTSLAEAQARGGVDSLDASPADRNLRQHSTEVIGRGDFLLRATVVIDEMSGRGAGITFDGGAVALDDREWGAVLTGRLFGGGKFPFETERPAAVRPGAPIEVEIQRVDGTMMVRLNEVEMGRIGIKDFTIGRIGFELAAGSMRVLGWSVEGDVSSFPRPRAVFTGADGDIDEFRDPSAASDGARALVTAVAVSTEKDGSAKTTLYGRFVNPSAESAARFEIPLDGVAVDFAVLGFRAGDARPWKLLVQEDAPKHLVERLLAFDSADGRAFARVAELDSKGSPLMLVASSLRAFADGRLACGATRLVDAKPRAAMAELSKDGSWRIVDLDAAPGCEPLWLGDDDVLIRLPRQSTRELLHAGARAASDGFVGAGNAGTLFSRADSVLRVAQSEPAFPYPLQELVSSDAGKTWKPARMLWGSSAGNVTSVTLGDRTLLVFEGGDRARREHVLTLLLPKQP